MALKFKVLGQSNPTGNSNTTLYGTPYYTSTVVSTLNVCNYGSGPATFDIAFQKYGANLIGQHYFSYRTPIAAKESIGISAGITLDQTDLVTVSANTSNVSFSLFGTENNTQGFAAFPIIEYLIVGAGGASYSSYGGGAGGFRTGTFSTPQTGNMVYTIVVGAAQNGNNGAASNISGGYLSAPISAAGGGLGYGNDGGSGGGGGIQGYPYGLGNTPPTIPPQGYNGGSQGGGGAGGVGVGMDGGPGANSSITGVDMAYAGGGGGGSGAGGIGGGGSGGFSGNPGYWYGVDGSPRTGDTRSGAPNSGGGGGNGGTAGSGVVIIRYPTSYPVPTANVGNPNVIITGGYRVYRFWQSGSITF
jgi:hypothetical protein